MRKCLIVKWFYLIKENMEKSIVINSKREAIMQFGKVELLINRKVTLIDTPEFFLEFMLTIFVRK